LGPYNATFQFVALFAVSIVLVNIYQALIQKTATVYRAFSGLSKIGSRNINDHRPDCQAVQTL